MKVIGLFGKRNQGKTTTLNQVIERLIELLKAKNGEVIEKIEEKRVNNVSDWRIAIKYKDNKYQDKKICIATGGDNTNAIRKNCAFFQKHNPYIAVSAVRTKGEPRAELIKYTKEEIIWIKKRGSADEKIQTELNNIDAYLVLKNILADIDEAKITISQSFQFEIS